VTDPGDLRLLTVEQLATLCQVSVKTVYRAIWRGRLRASQLGVGAAYRVRFDDVEEWLDASAYRARSPQLARSLKTKIAPRRQKTSTRARTEGRLFLPEEMDGST
jgi:excisionase family DNA binding protein